MIEKLRTPWAATLFAGSAILGTAACAASSNEVKPVVTEQPAPITNTLGDGQPEITQIYFPNGTRETVLIFRGTTYQRRSVAWCEGKDIVEQTVARFENHSVAAVRSDGHSACADGRLDPSDFSQE